MDGEILSRRLWVGSENENLGAICREEQKGDEVKGGCHAIVFALYLVR
jgi:hypothetical protein